MNYLITYFLPSILGLKLFSTMNKETNKFNLIIYYLLFVLFSNFFCMFILLISDQAIYNLSNTLENNLSFCFKYIFITMVLNIILSALFTIISKYLTISIEVEKDGKIKKRKNNKNN